MQVTHEVNMRELDPKQRLSRNGGSISTTASSSEKRVCIPKELVPNFVLGNDIDNWF